MSNLKPFFSFIAEDLCLILIEWKIRFVFCPYIVLISKFCLTDAVTRGFLSPLAFDWELDLHKVYWLSYRSSGNVKTLTLSSASLSQSLGFNFWHLLVTLQCHFARQPSAANSSLAISHVDWNSQIVIIIIRWAKSQCPCHVRHTSSSSLASKVNHTFAQIVFRMKTS